MKITLNINNIDYESIIDQSIPLLKEKAPADNNILLKTISGILSMPGDIPKKMLNALPQETKDELVVYLINSNKDKIAELLQNTLANKGIELRIDDIEIKK
ncbi:MAG: hypothetical protein IKI97_09970 [Clostridia bacterium]|nr:hypothetical protein [Clostridia bacterium]